MRVIKGCSFTRFETRVELRKPFIEVREQAQRIEQPQGKFKYDDGRDRAKKHQQDFVLHGLLPPRRRGPRSSIKDQGEIMTVEPGRRRQAFPTRLLQPPLFGFCAKRLSSGSGHALITSSAVSHPRCATAKPNRML